MARTISKTANVYTRVDPATTEQEERKQGKLGIPKENAIGMLLKQVVIQRGMPFEMRLPAKKTVSNGELTKEQFDAERQLGRVDMAAGRVIVGDDVEKERRRRETK